jgi:hypothetical protein
MAKALGITAQSLGLWCKRPNAPVRVDGNRVWCKDGAFQRWRETELVSQAVKDLAPAVSLDEARTRKALAEAELAELDVGKARGEWVSVADYTTAVGRVLDHAMARLRAIPVRLSHLGAEVEASAETEVERIVHEMSAFDDDVVDEEPQQPESGKAAA